MKTESGIVSLIKFFLVGAIIIALAAGVYWAYDYFRYSKLPKIPVTDLNIEEDPQLRKKAPKVVYRGGVAKLQDSAAVYISSTSLVKLREIKATAVAKSFGFSGSPKKAGDILIWSVKGKSFSADLDEQTITLSGVSINEPEIPISEFPTKNEVAFQARQAIRKADLPEEFIDFENPVVGYSLARGVEPAKDSKPPSLARIMEVEYSYKLGKTQIYGADTSPLGFEIQVAKGNKLVGFTIPWQPFTWQQLENYPLKSIGDAVNEIKEGRGSIAQLTTIKVGRWTQKLKNITTMQLDKVKLAYYPWVNEEGYLVPIYIFSGKAALASGELTNVTMYVLAVPDRFVAE